MTTTGQLLLPFKLFLLLVNFPADTDDGHRDKQEKAASHAGGDPDQRQVHRLPADSLHGVQLFGLLTVVSVIH